MLGGGGVSPRESEDGVEAGLGTEKTRVGACRGWIPDWAASLRSRQGRSSNDPTPPHPAAPRQPTHPPTHPPAPLAGPRAPGPGQADSPPGGRDPSGRGAGPGRHLREAPGRRPAVGAGAGWRAGARRPAGFWAVAAVVTGRRAGLGAWPSRRRIQMCKVVAPAQHRRSSTPTSHLPGFSRGSFG